MLARAYSIMRGSRENKDAPLGGFFEICAPLIGVIPPEEYPLDCATCPEALGKRGHREIAYLPYNVILPGIPPIEWLVEFIELAQWVDNDRSESEKWSELALQIDLGAY